MRDSQRQRLYDAELEAWGGLPPDHPALRHLASAPQAEAFLMGVLRRAWSVRTFYPLTRIAVRRHRGRSAMACTYHIEWPRDGRPAWVALHELAHVEAGLHWKHGPCFALVYLALVRHVFGQEAYCRLRASFRRHRVRVAPMRLMKGRAFRWHWDSRERKAARP